MKNLRTPHIASALLALVVLVVPLTLRAEEAKEKPLSKVKEKYDADKDGTLSETEKAAAKEGAKARAKETREENLEKYDANKDGKLDKEERTKQKADAEAEYAAQKAERAAKKAAKAAKAAETK